MRAMGDMAEVKDSNVELGWEKDIGCYGPTG